MCPKCGDFESVKHFTLISPGYSTERAVMFDDIRQEVDESLFSMFLLDPMFALCCILGDHDDHFNKCFLNYVVKAWQIRSDS